MLGLILECRIRLHKAVERAQEIRVSDLDAARKQAALDEVTSEVRRRVTELIRDARLVAGGEGFMVEAPGIGGTLRPWYEGISSSGREAQSAMSDYIDSAGRAFEIELAALESGEAPSPEATGLRDALAMEVALYEEDHSAPAGVSTASSREPPIG